MSQLKIDTEQLFSRSNLGYLWSRRTELDPEQVKVIECLYNNRKKGQIEGKQSISYTLSRKKAGAMGYGRLYGNKGSLETLEREARGTLCRDFYDDIDIVNCHPVLLVQFAKTKYGKELTAVENYVQNRDEILSLVSSDRDAAKKEVIKVLYCGRPASECLIKLSEEIRGFSKELSKKEEYKELFETVKSETNMYGSFLSFILQTEERHCMLAIRDSFEAQGWRVDVLAYDGVMCRKREKIPLTDENLIVAEEYITAKTNYKVKLLNKPFEYFELPSQEEEIAPRVTKAAFIERKALYEQTHFYMPEQDMIVEIKSNGEPLFMTRKHCLNNLLEWDFVPNPKNTLDRISFLQLWLSNGPRKVNAISYKPTDDPNTYVVDWKMNYRTSKVPENKQEHIDLFEKLLTVWCGKDAVKIVYARNYLAHIIQCPYVLPGTSLVATGDKGVGKDTLIDFLMEWVIGYQHSINYDTTMQFFDKHDVGRRNKFVVKLEEADPKTMRANFSVLKSRITSTSQQFNPKGVAQMTAENFNRIIMTMNNADVGVIEENDRRFVVMTSCPDYRGNHAFWGEIRKTLFNKEGAAAIGDYLEHIPLEGWNPRILPKDEYKDLLAEDNLTPLTRFIRQWKGEKTQAVDLWNEYRNFCVEEGLAVWGDSRVFGKHLQEFVRDKIINRTQLHGRKYYNKVDASE